MPQHPEIRLRYFDARARAQFLRGYFNARGIEFEDERVPLDEGFASWSAIREDRSLSGPLQRLPVLHYGDQLIPETFVIAGFVHRKFGDAAVLSDIENLRHDVLVSSAYTDLMIPIAMLVWADLMFTGVDLPLFARNALGRIDRTLDTVEKAIAEWEWVAGMQRRHATVADCLLWEELDQALTVFGPHFTLDAKPQLQKFYSEHPHRETFANALAERPCQITGRPGEQAAIGVIRECLAAGGAV